MKAGGHQFNRPCLQCGTLTKASYCEAHKPKRPSNDTPAKRAKKRFLYGGDYARKAKQLRAGGGTCHLCGHPVPPGYGEADHLQPELGHRSPLAITHRACNQARGNKPLRLPDPRRPRNTST